MVLLITKFVAVRVISPANQRGKKKKKVNPDVNTIENPNEKTTTKRFYFILFYYIYFLSCHTILHTYASTSTSTHTTRTSTETKKKTDGGDIYTHGKIGQQRKVAVLGGLIGDTAYHMIPKQSQENGSSAVYQSIEISSTVVDDR